MRRVIIALVAAVSAITIALNAHKGINAEISAMIPNAENAALMKMASRMAVMHVKAPRRELAMEYLRKAGVELKEDGGESAKALAPYAKAFLSEATRTQLAEGRFEEVRREAEARIYSPLPAMIPASRDPFLLFTDYAASVARNDSGWQTIVTQMDCDEAHRVYEKVRRDENVICVGPAFHAGVTAAKSKREINLLSTISLVLAGMLGFSLFRSLRFLIPLATAILLAFLVAVAAVMAVFDEPHLITLVFGTSLVGLGVDYVYHACAAEDRTFTKPMTEAFLSTSLCFLPLAFAGLPVLVEMAVFTICGMGTIYLFAMTLSKSKMQLRVKDK